MNGLKKLLIIGFVLVGMAGSFAVGILTGFRYGEFNRLPFVAGGEWSIGIYTGDSPFDLAPPSAVAQPVLGPDDVTDMPARQVADPFMVRHNDVWYMFFEVLHASTEQGNIGFASSRDGFNWEYQKIVIDEEFHLSYPQVFVWEDEYYLIPESNEANAVLLYKADPFPSNWVKVDELLKVGGVDPTFFVHNDTCWMFLASRNRASLSLYYAADLRGPWFEHPSNPLIAFDRNRAGPAGPVLEREGILYRYAMDCDPDYGNAVRVFEIKEISATGYREVEIEASPILSGTGDGWNADRMHHCDAHLLDDGSWIAAVDGWARVVQIGLKY
jgi:sucrose-6-phosphate hydrolase SacC (GH32 family)